MTVDDWAVVGGRLATGVAEITNDAAALDTTGFWVVVQTFEGRLTAARMATVERGGMPPATQLSRVGDPTWRSSIDRESYVKGVETIRDRIAAGDVYQVNLCRILSADMPEPPDLRSLGRALAGHNPAPYAATIHLPSASIAGCRASGRAGTSPSAPSPARCRTRRRCRAGRGSRPGRAAD